MFQLNAQPIDARALASSLDNASAGALVVFEGRVRNRNHGRVVTQLEYEGAGDLASAEFARIVADARAQYDFVDASAAHRVGRLAPGDIAVWIGVTAVHRGVAFAVCQFLIDELKKRLPVWKKEFYEDGESVWINAP